MGIFSFIKNAGAKIFGSKRNQEAAVEKSTPAPQPTKAELDAAMSRDLESLVRGLGIEVDSLSVDFNSDTDTATIYGTVNSLADQEKVVLACGNVHDVASVVEYLQVREETANRSVGDNTSSRFYTVQKGDTLWKIATEMYGDGTRHKDIFEANRPMLKSPDAIYPDQVLRIPV
ncbi:MAG: peptidoglycan-binding protein LysM [Sphingobacteriales bacterium]|nr:peptidoglycan-binding protein LysM [Sphingobacteriales bacterium]